LKFSAPPWRSLRLCGEVFSNIQRGDAEVTKTSQRRIEIKHYGWILRPSGLKVRLRKKWRSQQRYKMK